MSAVTIQLTSVCSGGGHLRFAITGDVIHARELNLSDLTDPIEQKDADAFLRVITKLARMGRTAAQARTLLQNGVTVTV